MFGNYYAYDSIGPLADHLHRLLGFSDTQLGTLNAIYSFPNIIMVVLTAGPPTFVDASVAMTKSLGAREDRIFVDSFLPRVNQ